MRLLHLLILITSLSCGTFRPMEDRGLPQYSRSNVVPELTVQPLLLQGRFPASPPLNEEFEKISNKQLYFSALYAQYHEYLKLGFFPEKPIRHCPKLHETFLEIRKDSSMHLNSEFISSPYELSMVEQNPGLFPELHLPLKIDSPHPNVLDDWKNVKNKKPDLTQGIKLAINKLEGEITELCETGSTDNYFIIENLISFMSRGNSSNNEETIKRLLKTSLFVNFSIINALAKRNNHEQDKNFSAYHIELLGRLNTSWAIIYFRRLNENIRLSKTPSSGLN